MKKAGHNDWRHPKPGPNEPKQPIPIPKDQRRVLGKTIKIKPVTGKGSRK